MTTTVEAPAVEQVTSTIALPDRCLACPACGVATSKGEGGWRKDRLVTVEAFARESVPVPMRTPVVTTLARCSECEGRHLRAVQLCIDHPELGRRLGSSVAVWKAELSLIGASAIGVLTPSVMESIDERTVHRALIRHLSAPASSITWSSGCAPVQLAGFGPNRCSPTPWACAPPAALAVVRAGYAAMLAEKVAAGAPPTSIAPPPVSPRRGQIPLAGACLLCGVGAVPVSAAEIVRLGGARQAALQMWTPVTMSSRADHLSGHLCPPCADAYRRVGSLGPTCVERAITAHLEATGRAQQALALTARLAGDNPPRLVAWATLSHRAVIGQKPPFPPSSRSWSHCRIPKA